MRKCDDDEAEKGPRKASATIHPERCLLRGRSRVCRSHDETDAGGKEEKTRRSALTVCSYAKNESPISEFESITLAFHEKRGAAVSLRSLERVDRCRRAGTRFRRSCLGGVAVWKTRKKYTTTWFPPQPKRSRTAVDRHSGRTGPRATDTKGTRVRRRVFRVLSSPSRPHAGVGQRRCVRAPYGALAPKTDRAERDKWRSDHLATR